MVTKKVRYEEQSKFMTGGQRLGAPCPFCGAVAKAYINKGAVAVFGDCDHFVADPVHVIEAVFEKEDEDEQNHQG